MDCRNLLIDSIAHIPDDIMVQVGRTMEASLELIGTRQSCGSHKQNKRLRRAMKRSMCGGESMERRPYMAEFEIAKPHQQGR